MSISQNPESLLPILPRKFKVQPDHLRFREPANASAERRVESLNNEIQSLLTEQEVLKQDQKELSAKCRQTLEEMQRRHVGITYGQSRGSNGEYKSFGNPFRSDDFSVDNAEQQFAQSKEALMKILDSYDKSKDERKADASKIEKLDGDITRASEKLDIEKQKISELHKKVQKLKTDQGQRLKKVEKEEGTIRLAVSEEQEEQDEEDEQDEEEEQNEHQDHAHAWQDMKTPQIDTTNRRQGKPGETSETINNRQDKGLIGQEASENQTPKEESKMQMIAHDKEKQERERRIQMMEEKNRIHELGKEISSIQQKISIDKARLDRRKVNFRKLKRMRNELQDKPINNEQYSDGSSNHQVKEDEDRANEERERVSEYEQQQERQTKIRAMLDDLLFWKIRISRERHYGIRMDFDDNDDDGIEGQVQTGETLLNDAGVLEALISKLRRLRHKSNRSRDLRITLERELNLEKEWIAQVKEASKPIFQNIKAPKDSKANDKDHLASNVLEKYKVYTPLQPHQIRLLHLMPAPEDCTHYPLICHLSDTSPGNDDKIEYVALSYHWGPDSNNGRLYLLRHEDEFDKIDRDDWGYVAKRAIRIPIRNNLFRALLHLRNETNEVALWVDFLCINQSNPDEKTTQLSNMANVYHGAKNVCIWLGEADAQRKSDEAMRFIPEIMDFAVLDRHARDKNQARKWYALAELMRDRWFSRRWVVQEIALARSATIHCGDEMVHWLDFADAVSLLASNQEIIKNLFSDWRDGPNTLGEVKSFGAYILLEATSKLFLRMAKGGIRRPITSIESLVTSLKTFDTSDQRDLIYSLVSIACDTTQNSGVYSTDTRANESQQLVIDYRKPEVEVYIDFTKFCIKSSCSLDIFCRPWAMPVKASDSSSNTAQIPSWIPLLSTSEYGAPDDVYSGRKNGENLVGPVGSPRYKASGNKKYSAEEKNEEVENSNQSLLVRGFKLGKIERVSPRSTGGVIVRESLMMGFKKGTLNYGDSVPDKIWRTLVADRDPHGQIPPAWYQRACLRCLEIADTFNNGDLNIGELLQGNSDMLRKYLTRVRNVTWNRRFFTARRWNEHTESISIRKSGSFGVSTVSQENKLGDSGAQSKQDKQSKQVGSGDDVDAAAATGVGSTNQAQEKDDDQDTDGSNGGSSEEEVSESEDDNEGSGKEEVLKSGDDNRSDGGIHNRKVNKNNENEDDELFGLGPPQMTEGDIICILFGSSVPVVLRRITEESAQVCYQLVGEVYAHGQMDGEAISDFEEQIIEMNEETFELR